MDVFLDSLKVAGFGIGVTFLMLFLIIGFIKLLKFLLDLLDKVSDGVKNLSKKKRNNVVVQNKVEQESLSVDENQKLDQEIVAAIVAAICYETGMSSNMFVLKKVRQRSKNVR